MNRPVLTLIIGSLLLTLSCGGPTGPSSIIVVDPIHLMATTTIRGTFRFDFDDGLGGNVPVPTGGDVFWQRLTSTTSSLVPLNGARIASLGVVDLNSVSRADVERAGLATVSIADPDLPVGTVVVYQTDQGRFGKFRIDGFSGNEDMAITFVTFR